MPNSSGSFTAPAPKPKVDTKPASDILAGAVARAASQGTIHPLDTLKVRMQARGGVSKFARLVPPAGAGTGKAVKAVLPGIASLYRGVGGAASGAGIYIGTYFALYGAACNLLARHTDLAPGGVAFVAGAAAAAGGSVVKVPLAVCIRSVQAGVYPNVFNAASSIVRAAGVRGMFTGYWPTLLEDVPDMAFKFAAYESMRSLHRRLTNGRRPANVQEDFAMGAVAGAFAAAATTPLDVIKTNMMCSAASRPTMLGAARTIAAGGSGRQFFRGVGPRALSNGINSAIFFCFFEALRGAFKRRQAERLLREAAQQTAPLARTLVSTRTARKVAASAPALPLAQVDHMTAAPVAVAFQPRGGPRAQLCRRLKDNQGIWSLPKQIAQRPFCVPGPGNESIALTSKRCLDLSAGCGLVGLVLSALGCQVTATDLAPNLPLLAGNYKRNGLSANIVEHRWGTNTSALQPPFDVIVACDVMYIEAAVPALDFDERTSRGDWLINIYAPWCKHCQQLEPVWQNVAERLNGRMHVAKINGESNRVLIRRFLVEAYPSIYLIKAGKVYEYDGGPRSEQQFEEWALVGYLEEEPLPAHRSPVSLFGRTLGFFMGLPGRIHRFSLWASREKGVSELTLLLGLLSVPITLGVLGICALDFYYTRMAAASYCSYVSCFRSTLTATLSLCDTPCQHVERYSKPEVEFKDSPELLLEPVLICRNTQECALFEASINSVRISLKVRQRDVLEQWLVARQMNFLMDRAEAFRILRRSPVAGYDISFLISAQHCQHFEEGPLVDFLASFLEDTCGTSEVKLAVSSRGRAVAGEYLRALAG
ncbi:hypothetical protein WJX81_004183 [Elliptochloris bilobata]|uniref:Thioredoxin domain-containing protein n=1 Tax=Elliptochloris bilobata TaxID=381761 RepID=A0AAW1QL51_9CHLO